MTVTRLETKVANPEEPAAEAPVRRPSGAARTASAPRPVPQDAAAQPAAIAKKTPDIIQVLATCVQKGGSDVILTLDSKPRIRIGGRLRTYGEEVLTADQTKKILYGLLTDEQKAEFEEKWEIDFAVAIRNVGRFRVNGFRQRGAVGAAFRPIPSRIPTVDDLDLPKVIRDVATYPKGLVLITGVTGSGKSTLLAAILNKINCEREVHIVTIEDPVEFIHPHRKALVEQRQVGDDTKSFGSALKHVLRQNPDVILLGEMRDPETMRAAITLAETGHLVFSTLHTQTCAQTMDRIVDSFSAEEQAQVRAQLSLTLKAVVSQTLLPSRDGSSRCAAREVMLITPAISALLREGKTHMITNSIATNRAMGMVTMDHSIKELIEAGKVDPLVAATYLKGILGVLQGDVEGKDADPHRKPSDDPDRADAPAQKRPEDIRPSTIEEAEEEAASPIVDVPIVTIHATMPSFILEKAAVAATMCAIIYLKTVATLRVAEANLQNAYYGMALILGFWGLHYMVAKWRRDRALN